jgi:tripartite-type tricarboxylate transporter receptor subunit TctC
MPDEVKKTLVSAIEKAVKNPELKAKVDKMGFLVDYKSPSDLNKLVKEDYETANAIAIRIGLRK